MTMREAVRQIVAETNLADPAEISDKLISDLDPDDYEGALRQVLPEFVRQELSRARMQTRSGPPPVATAETPGMKGKQTFRSRKVAAYQSWGRKLRAMRVPGDGAEWKILNDCAAVDLVKIVELNRSHAARNLSTAAQYENLLTALRKAKAITVAELDDATVEAAFGKAAA